jgi:hypothetical protein
MLDRYVLAHLAAVGVMVLLYAEVGTHPIKHLNDPGGLPLGQEIDL